MLRLRQLRNAKNMSREELGAVVGLSKSMIAALELIIKERLMKLGMSNLSKTLTIIRLYISGPVMITLVTLEILLSYGFSVEIIEFDNIGKEFINLFKR